MKRIIGLFILLSLGVFVGLHLTPGHGEIYVVLSKWTISAPLWLFVLAGFIAYVLIRIILRLLAFIFRLPSALCHWRENAHKQHLSQHLQKGLLALCEGDWMCAEHQFSKIKTQDSLDLTAQILSAWAMQQTNNTAKRDTHIANALLHHPKAKLAILFTQLTLNIQSANLDNTWDNAWETLRQIALDHPKHPYLCLLWIHITKKTGVIDNNISSKEALIARWQMLPKTLYKNIDMQICYAQQLIHYGADSEAEKICREILHHEWNEQAMSVYGLCTLEEMDAQLRFAQSCVEKYPNQTAVFLTLGRLFARRNLWGQAREYFELSIQIKASIDACVALAQLLEQDIQEPKAAEHYYKKAALLANEIK